MLAPLIEARPKENELFKLVIKTINKLMIKNFLVINCTGKKNIIALRINNNFFF